MVSIQEKLFGFLIYTTLAERNYRPANCRLALLYISGQPGRWWSRYQRGCQVSRLKYWTSLTFLHTGPLNLWRTLCSPHLYPAVSLVLQQGELRWMWRLTRWAGEDLQAHTRTLRSPPSSNCSSALTATALTRCSLVSFTQTSISGFFLSHVGF